jgi:hypothetical protein
MRKQKQKSETNLARGPTKGIVITMDNKTGWRVAEKLKETFKIEDMQVVVGSACNYRQDISCHKFWKTSSVKV